MMDDRIMIASPQFWLAHLKEVAPNAYLLYLAGKRAGIDVMRWQRGAK